MGLKQEGGKPQPREEEVARIPYEKSIKAQVGMGLSRQQAKCSPAGEWLRKHGGVELL